MPAGFADYSLFFWDIVGKSIILGTHIGILIQH